MAVLSHFHGSRVPSIVNSEAGFRVQQHEVPTSLKNVLLIANFLLGQTVILLLSLQAACHKERHVSRKAVSFIHDILTEVLTDWNEPSHFHFNEALFRPFERIMQLELCDEDVQDQASQPWSGCLYLTTMPIRRMVSRVHFLHLRAFPMCPSSSSRNQEGSAYISQHCGRAWRQYTWL